MSQDFAIPSHITNTYQERMFRNSTNTVSPDTITGGTVRRIDQTDPDIVISFIALFQLAQSMVLSPFPSVLLNLRQKPYLSLFDKGKGIRSTIPKPAPYAPTPC